MRICWNRVAALLLSILATFLLAYLWGPIVVFQTSMAAVVDQHSTPDEHLKGMMAFALAAVCVLGVIRLLVGSNRRDS